MNYFSKALRYCRLHLRRSPKYFFSYVRQYFKPGYVPNIQFYPADSVSRLVAEGKSLIRFGDGEIYLLNHGDIPFERSSPRLRTLMMESIREYTDQSPFIIGLNKVPLLKSNKELREKGLLTCWLPSKVYFDRYFNKNASYADAAMFYFKETIPTYFEAYFRTRKVIVVSNEKTCRELKMNQHIPFVIEHFIITPMTNSFETYDEIKNSVLRVADALGRNHVTVLAAFGPASKALAYELANDGVQVLDVGQGITAAYTGFDHSLSENIRVLE